MKSECPVIRGNNRETVVCGTGMATGGFVQSGHQVAYPIPLIFRNRAVIRDQADSIVHPDLFCTGSWYIFSNKYFHFSSTKYDNNRNKKNPYNNPPDEVPART
jgi:hypothetical protein